MVSTRHVISSFSSAPPPAIEISTPWEIIVRVSSASDLPRPWQLLGGLSRLHPFPLSGAFGLPSQGLWISFWFRSVFVEHTCIDVPTLYPALGDVSRLAFCTVGNPPSSVNTRSLVLDYRWSSCPGGPALWYCTLSWVAGSVRSVFEKLWPRVRPPCSYFSVVWRAFLLLLPTRQIRLHRTATSFFSCHLICPFGWHPTAPHDSWHLHCWVALLAGWLPSPFSSAPTIYSMVANLALGYAVSRYSTTSLAHAKVRSIADFPGSPPVMNAYPPAD